MWIGLETFLRQKLGIGEITYISNHDSFLSNGDPWKFERGFGIRRGDQDRAYLDRSQFRIAGLIVNENGEVLAHTTGGIFGSRQEQKAYLKDTFVRLHAHTGSEGQEVLSGGDIKTMEQIRTDIEKFLGDKNRYIPEGIYASG